MKKLMLMATIVAMCGCAIPVRPVAKIVPDSDGTMHFTPDKAQEPHMPPGFMTTLINGASDLLKNLGPAGELGGMALTALAGGAAVHKHHTKKSKKNEKAPAPAAA